MRVCRVKNNMLVAHFGAIVVVVVVAVATVDEHFLSFGC